jgi:hypothetical protein
MPRTKPVPLTDQRRRELDAQSRIRTNAAAFGVTWAVETYGQLLINAFNVYFSTPTDEQWTRVQEAAYDYQYTRLLDDEEHARQVAAAGQ